MTTLVEPIKQMAETKMAGGLITKVKQDYYFQVISDHERNHDFYLQDSSDHKGIHDGLPGDDDFHGIKSSVVAII